MKNKKINQGITIFTLWIGVVLGVNLIVSEPTISSPSETNVSNELLVNPSQIESEKWNIVFDKRKWKNCWSGKINGATTNNYILEEEDEGNWTEMVSTMFSPYLKNIPAEKFVKELFLPGLQKITKGSTTEIHFLPSENPAKEFFWELQIKEPLEKQQNLIERVLASEKGLYVVFYSIRKSDMGEAWRNQWLNNLKQSSLK